MKRIISTILTISMLFTMTPAFASDIETSDVNNIAQLFSVGSGETVYASSADKLNVIRADFSSLEVGTYTETKSGKNCKINVKANSTGSFTVNDDGSVTLKQSSGYEDASFEFHNTPRTGMVVSTFKIKYDVLPTAWTRLEYSSNFDFSSFCVTGGKFALNNTYKVDGETKGAVDDVSSAIVEDMWYTVTYLINNAEKTYKLDIVDENGDSIIIATTEDWSFRPTTGGAVTGTVGTLAMNTAQGGQNEFTVKDIYAYQVVDVCDFDVIGPESLVEGSNDFRMEYNNTTSDEVDFEAFLVGYDADGVVVGSDIEAGTIKTGSDVIDLQFDAVAADSYKLFVNEPDGASLTIKAGGVSTDAPEDFLNVDYTAEGKLAVTATKDNNYNIATVTVYDENDDIVGYAQQKNAGTAMLFAVPEYNKEYKVQVMLNDAGSNVVTEETSLVAWNPVIAEDFNADVEAAFETHYDAIAMAYEGDFAALYEENADYIINYISERTDYQSVFDVVDAIYAAEGYIAVVSAEDEAAFTQKFEENAASFGIALDDTYKESKDVIISKLFEVKDDCIVPEELAQAYEDVYVACVFNNAPAILYGKLFAKYADKLGITITKEYYAKEVAYNDAVYALKVDDFGGAFGTAEDVTVAFKKAGLGIADMPKGAYATVGTSPLTQLVTTVNFEANSAPWAVSYKIGNDASKGIAEVVDYNGNNVMKITQYAGYEDEVVFAVNNQYSSATYDTMNIKERLMFENLDTGYLFLRTRAGYLYIENGKWGINYGGGNMVTSGTKEDVTTDVWYNLDFDFDFPAKKFDLVITKDDGTVVFEDYDCDFRGGDANSMMIQTPHKDKDSDGNDRTTAEDTILYVDDIVITAPSQEVVYYTAKASEAFVSGINGVSVEMENCTTEDRNINVYIPVYVDGKLYTIAHESAYVKAGNTADLIVSYTLDESLFGADPADIKIDVIVADGFDGVNHSVKSDTAAGTLSVDASADFENDVINVTADSTFDNGTIIVLAPGATLANAIPSDILYYAAGNTAAVKVADGIKGDLKVYAVAQDADYNVTVANDTVYYPGNGVADELVAAFSDVTEDNIAAVVADHMAVINAIEPGMATFYAENAVAVDAALVANKPYETVDQIIKTIKSVEVLKALVAAATEAEFETAFNEFAVMFEVELDAIYEANEDKFIADLYAAKDTFNTYEDVMNAFADIYLVCGINNANENTIGSLLTGFADVLGITIDDVYTTKQAYIDRLVAADMPFADKAAIVSSYNNAYAKAEALEGDFSKKTVAASATQISKFTVDFEDCEPVNGAIEAVDVPFSFSRAGDGSFDIAEDGNNKYLVYRQSQDTAKNTTNVGFSISSYFGENTTVQYDIRFDKFNKKWTMLNLGAISSLYVGGGMKFTLNEDGSPGGEQREISTALSKGVWYTVKYTINVPDESYNITITDNTGAVIADADTKFRRWDTTDTKNASLNLYTSQDDGEPVQISVDNVSAYSAPTSGTYYTVTGTTTLLPGENVFTAEITNTDAVDRVYKVFVPVYADGKLVSIDKEEITVLAKSDKTEDIEFTAPMTGKSDYKIFLVDSLNGVNYGISSKVEGQATTTPAAPVADYTARAIKVSGETTYDNMTVIVTAPTANSNVYDIDTANANPDVIAYYDNIELKKVNEVNTFAANIKIPDRFADGDYYVYFVSQNKDGQAVTLRKTVYYAGSAKLDDMLADFNAITAETAETTINTYMDVLLGVASDMDAFYTANKAAVNEAVVAGKPYANVGVINNTIFAIYAADKLKNVTDADTFKSTLEYYASVFGIDVTSAEYIAGAAEINNRLFSDRANITKLNLADKFANALMLSEFNNATRETAPAVLDKYASKLGITVNAAYIDSIAKTIAADGVVFNSAQDVVDAYNAGISLGGSSGTGSAPTPSTPVGGLGGGGGGGGGATTDKVYFDKPYVEAEKTVDGGSATAAFNDLDSVSWAVEAITELKRIGVINGVSETEFAPNREVTREEFAKMIVNAFSITGEGKSFADVPATAWYAPFVTALASSGIVNGVTDTKFGVGANITRQDAAVILDRTALKSGIEYEYDYSALNIFTDYIADYAVDSIYRLYQNRVISGTSATTFSATATLTRAQAAKMIYSLMQLK